MHKKISVLMALSLLATSAVAQSNCDQQAEAEQLRVGTELSASAPDKNDTAAYQAWSKRMHGQLEAIAKKHEECRKASKNTPSGISAQKSEECLSMVIRKQQTVRNFVMFCTFTKFSSFDGAGQTVLASYSRQGISP